VIVGCPKSRDVVRSRLPGIDEVVATPGQRRSPEFASEKITDES
jgi:hypothetical protein